MKNKKASNSKDLIQKIDTLLSNIESMSDEEFRNILDSMHKFHKYSTNNQFLLSCYGASQVAGFRQWQKLKRKVKKGEKALRILAPSSFWINREDIKGTPQIIREVKKNGVTMCKVLYFKDVPVFDISQTEGEPIAKGMTTQSDITLNPLLETASRLGYTVDNKPMPISTGGYISGNDIFLNSNLAEIEHIGTVIHELAHGLLNHIEKGTERELAEQQAEAVTYIVAQHYGIKRNSEFYLKSWKLSESIKDTLEEVSKASSKIIETIQESISYIEKMDTN